MCRMKIGENVRIVESEDGGAVLLDEVAGVYWQLNGSAFEMVNAFREGRTTTEVVDRLADRYDVDRLVVADDVAGVVARLEDLGLGERS